MSGRALLYGATGYTGREVAARLAEAGADLVLAGRNAERVRAVAEPLGLAWRAFELTSAPDREAALDGIDVVLHAAGPFEQTAKPMMSACLAKGAHYLDLTGEWPVFAEALELDAAAKAAGIMLMPGVGLNIVATDCLMAMAVRLYPDTVKIRLGVSRPQVVSRGTAVSAVGLLNANALIRRNGQLTPVPGGGLSHAFDFGDGLRETVALSWADVVTGEFTTGVGDIEVYSELGWPARMSYRATSMAMEVTGARPWRRASRTLADVWPEAPPEETRRRAGFVMVVEAVDAWRRVRRLRMRTLDGYTVSVLTASAAVEQVLEGTLAAGFQTPARVFGADFILGLDCASLDGAAERIAGVAA
jgi:short subunit dehydrogenase-like uncharacterized protein